MKKTLTFFIITIGIISGVLISLQIRSGSGLNNSFIADEVEAKEALIKEYLDEQTYLQSRVINLRKEIENAQNNIDIHAEDANLALLEHYKKEIGLGEVYGKGVEIVLDDSAFAIRGAEKINDGDLIQASDLRDVVNILNTANVEAISINGQRIISTSHISSVGATILINNAHTTPPFVVKAVGDSEIILQRLLNKTLLKSIYDRSARGQIEFRITIKESLKIPIYNGELKTDYLNLTDEEDNL